MLLMYMYRFEVTHWWCIFAEVSACAEIWLWPCLQLADQLLHNPSKQFGHNWSHNTQLCGTRLWCWCCNYITTQRQRGKKDLVFQFWCVL